MIRIRENVAVKNDHSTQTAFRFVRLLIKIGSTAVLEPEERHRRIPAVIILITAIVTMAGFFLYHLLFQDYTAAAIDGLAGLFFLATLFYLRRTRQGLPAYRMITFSFIIIFSLLILLGRTEVSYFLWALVFPPAIFSILGKKGGLQASLLFFATSLFLMAAPAELLPAKPYSYYILVRYCIVYLIISGIIYYHEASQQLLFRYVQKEKSKEEKEARRDPLTGLASPQNIMEKIAGESQRQLRLGKPFAIIISDIDNFKNINDAYGRDCGDHILKAIARLLQEQLRDMDCPARWGDDMFLILLAETDIEQARFVAERIRKNLAETPFPYKDQPLSLTMTFGLSIYQGMEDDIERCLKRAERALQAGKRQGKNRVIVA